MPFGSDLLLGERLGAGATGEVLRATSRSTGEQVAVKLLRPDLAQDPVVVARFLQEAQALARLRHPALVALRDVVLEGGRLGLVMDLVEGGDLRRRLQAAGRLAPAEATALLAEVADALAVVHGAGATHRDVKPENVLLDRDGSPRLADLGIARLAQSPALTRQSGVVGTPDYLAPEAAEGDAQPASDVYALGVVLHELLAGATPFGTGHPVAVLRRHLEEPPPVLPVPAPLQALLADLLAKDPGARPTAVEAAARLRGLGPALAGAPALVGDLPGYAPGATATRAAAVPLLPSVAASGEPSSASTQVSSRVVPAVTSEPVADRRRPVLLGAAAAALLLLVGAGAVLLTRDDDEPRPLTTAAATASASASASATASVPPVPSLAPTSAAPAGAVPPPAAAPGAAPAAPAPVAAAPAPAAPAPAAPAPAPARTTRAPAPPPPAPAPTTAAPPRQPAAIPGGAGNVRDRRCSGAASTSVPNGATVQTVSCIGYITSSTGKQLVQADTFVREVPGSAHNAYGRFRVWVQLRNADGSFVTERICEVTAQFDSPASDPYWAQCGLSADTAGAGKYSVGFARAADPAVQTDPGRLSKSPPL